MWTILKLDQKKINLLKDDLNKNLGSDFRIYNPKISIQKYRNNKLLKKELNLLGNYVFCFHKKFYEPKIINSLKNLRGLKYFLQGFLNSQNEITSFIEKCKQLEDEKGLISANLFELHLNNYYKFASGPFVEKIFKIIEFQKNNINILMGNLKTKIKKKDFLFSPL